MSGRGRVFEARGTDVILGNWARCDPLRVDGDVRLRMVGLSLANKAIQAQTKRL